MNKPYQAPLMYGTDALPVQPLCESGVSNASLNNYQGGTQCGKSRDESYDEDADDWGTGSLW